MIGQTPKSNIQMEIKPALQQQCTKFIFLDNDYIMSIRQLREKIKGSKMHSQVQQLEKETVKIGHTEFYYNKLLETKYFVPQFIEKFFTKKDAIFSIEEEQIYSEDQKVAKTWIKNLKLIKNIYFPNLCYNMNSQKYHRDQSKFVFQPIFHIGFLNLKLLLIHQSNHQPEQKRLMPIPSLESIAQINIPNIEEIHIFLINIVSLKSLQNTNFRSLRVLINYNEQQLFQNFDNNLFRTRFYNQNRGGTFQASKTYQINLNTMDISSLAKFELTRIKTLASKEQIRYYDLKNNQPTYYHLAISQKYMGLKLQKFQRAFQYKTFWYGNYLPNQNNINLRYKIEVYFHLMRELNYIRRNNQDQVNRDQNRQNELNLLLNQQGRNL